MSTVQLLHTADTHLGYRQYGIIEREKDFYEVFDEIVDVAIREHVNLVVHGGDLFDTTRPPPQAFRAAIRSLRKLNEHGICFVVVAGDHDTPKRSILSPLAVLEDVGLARAIGAYSEKPERIRVRCRGSEVLVAGVRSQRGAAARQRLLDHFKGLRPDSDRPSILLLHQALREVSPEYEVELRELPRGYAYYALGHIHLYRELTLEDSKVVYPGSPEVLRVDEAVSQRDRYVVLAEVGRARTVSLSRVKLTRVRPFIYKEAAYAGLEALRSQLARIREEAKALAGKNGKKPLVYLKIRRVPRGARTDIHGLVETILGSAILDYRLQIETVIENAGKTLDKPVTSISLHELLEAAFGNKELAELAAKLIDVLAVDPKSYAIREAYQLIAEKFGLEREVKLA